MILMKQILSAVEYLHESGIIHRNINPDILYVNPSTFEVKLNEFSLAIKTNKSQIETECCGQRGYMAPEVLNKTGYGFKADIFSCGLVFYYLYFSMINTFI
jgi:serine/threonine protein kinase